MNNLVVVGRCHRPRSDDLDVDGGVYMRGRGVHGDGGRQRGGHGRQRDLLGRGHVRHLVDVRGDADGEASLFLHDARPPTAPILLDLFVALTGSCLHHPPLNVHLIKRHSHPQTQASRWVPWRGLGFASYGEPLQSHALDVAYPPLPPCLDGLPAPRILDQHEQPSWPMPRVKQRADAACAPVAGVLVLWRAEACRHAIDADAAAQLLRYFVLRGVNCGDARPRPA
ncbi:hypothetical protein BS78_07G211000 [Paspalum vaginatum]|nr:hypothetical protein BS78_07G211000 [Paspalum vaginatum]